MKEKVQKFSKFFILVTTRVALAAAIIFIIFNIGRSIWKNYQINKEIQSIENEIYKIKILNQNLKFLNLYYQTSTYKELQARIKLNYKKQGENVLIVTDIKSDENIVDTITPTNTENETVVEETTNFIRWYNYIIGNNQ